KVQEQPLLVLQALLENPGALVTTDELQKRIWPSDTFVDFDHGLHAAVNRLRAALSDSAENPRYVETVARRGYRFIGHIEASAAEDKSKVVPVVVPALVTKPAPAKRTWIGAIAGFGAAVLLAAVLVWTNFYGLRTWIFGATRSFRSLAVLPLVNL